MRTIKSLNADEAFIQAIIEFRMRTHEVEESRAGKVRALAEPLCVKSQWPTRRVLFNKGRNANPYFHFFEALWILRGEKNAEFPSRFCKNVYQFAEEDTGDFHGAYGWRLREHFGIDQINKVVLKLRNNPQDRRTVMSIWDPDADLDSDVNDIPCNIALCPRVVNGALDLTVFNRSNDIVWGMLGTNIVSFSMIQEYMAAGIGVRVGSLYQISVNAHIYERHFHFLYRDNDQGCQDLYNLDRVRPYPMVESYAHFGSDLFEFFEADRRRFSNPFFKEVVMPMMRSWEAYEGGDITTAKTELHYCMASDWKLACTEWLQRKGGEEDVLPSRG